MVRHWPAFDQQRSMAAMYSFETRGIERDSLFIMADLRFEDGLEPVRVTVRNLSARGMMVEFDLRVKRGQRVSVQLRNIGIVPGAIVWVRSPRFGIAFEHDIDPKLARAPLQMIPRDTVYTRPSAPTAPTGTWSGKLRRV